jgi:hypothetical protein
MSPFALLVWRLPMIVPIWLSPLEFLTTAAPSISRSRTLPDPVVTPAATDDVGVPTASVAGELTSDRSAGL